jgi:hypothetical protein
MFSLCIRVLVFSKESNRVKNFLRNNFDNQVRWRAPTDPTKH